MSFRGLYVALVIAALAACGPDAASDGTDSSTQDLTSCPQSCSEACPQGDFCQPDANGCMSCQAPSGDFCEVPSDCKGAVPQYCPRCSNGSDGCAHWGCVNAVCQILTCS